MNCPLALIAGNGTLPLEVGRTIKSKGQELLTIAIKGEAIPELSELTSHWFNWGQLGKIFGLLKKYNCHDVILLGGISKRPNFQSIIGDFGTIARIPKIISVMNGGDSNVINGIIQLFESDGFEIVGVQKYVPEFLAGLGNLTQIIPKDESCSDIEIATNAVKTLGQLDIGQGVVVVGGRIIAVEAAEGTDLMLHRCIDMQSRSFFSWKGRKGVLVKCTKPNQDLRVDLPTIGPKTVELVAQAGLAGIVISGETVLVAERTQTINSAEKYGVFVKGI